MIKLLKLVSRPRGFHDNVECDGDSYRLLIIKSKNYKNVLRGQSSRLKNWYLDQKSIQNYKNLI